MFELFLPVRNSTNKNCLQLSSFLLCQQIKMLTILNLIHLEMLNHQRRVLGRRYIMSHGDGEDSYHEVVRSVEDTCRWPSLVPVTWWRDFGQIRFSAPKLKCDKVFNLHLVTADPAFSVFVRRKLQIHSAAWLFLQHDDDCTNSDAVVSNIQFARFIFPVTSLQRQNVPNVPNILNFDIFVSILSYSEFSPSANYFICQLYRMWRMFCEDLA